MADSVSTSTPSRAASPELPALPNFSRQQPYRFHWDQATRRQGPGSVYSETTDARADLLATGPRPELLDSTLSSLAPGAFPQEWSSSKHGFHAISTMLNNPHKKAAPPKAHSSLPPVPPADLPRVKRRDFDGYLKAIKPEWERFQNSLKTAAEPTSVSSPADELPLSPLASPLTAIPPSPRTARPLHVSSKHIPPLDTVPSIYFDDSFNLGDPRTFAAVAELPPSSGLHPDTRDPASISHALPLLEKLSHYADVVELHLVKEISLRSSSFFAALSNLNDLQSESSECLGRIGRLRDMLREVDERTAKRGLEIVRMEKKLRNLEAVSDGVTVVKNVGDMIGAAHTLVNAGEWGEALDMIEDIETLWRTVPPSRNSNSNGIELSLPVPRRTPSPRPSSPLPTVQEDGAPPPPPKQDAPSIPIASLSAFAALPEHLRELSLQIATSLTFDLASILKSDLQQRLEQPQPHQDQTLKDRLRPVLQGLLRTNGVKEAMSKYKDVVVAEVRAAVTRHLPLADAGDEEASSERRCVAVIPTRARRLTVPVRSNALAEQLRSMSHDQFIELSRRMFTSLIRCMETVQLQSNLLIEVVQTLSPPPRSPLTPTPRSPAPLSPLESSLQTSLQELLGSAAELANTRCGKIFAIRGEQHAALPLADFCAVYEAAWTFVLRSEVLNRKMIVGLRGVMLTQSKAFLAAFHAVRISQSAKLVEEETWAQVEILPEAQRTTDLLIECAMRDPPEMVLSRAPTAPSTPVVTMNGNGNGHAASPESNGANSPDPAKKATQKTLNVEGTAFFAVGATLAVLELAADYLRAVLSLGALSSEAVGKVIEFLKAFNSRTCQVVLGAGAMRSAGLKNITAKHLALASQSLAIVIALIPYVRETFRRHLSPKQAVMLVDFDKLKRDFQEHQYEIHEKLVAIMKDRLLVHCKSLQEVQWELAAEQPGPNAYMKLLVKETETLHKVLSKYLPPPVLELIMTQVLASIKNQLSEEFGSLELQSQAAKDRILVDVRYLQERLGGLKNVAGGLGNTVETVVQERPVPRKSLRERMSGVSSTPASVAVDAGGGAEASGEDGGAVNGDGEGGGM
ncbi:Vps54-domain-containing protein [Exidia glandulosa HHB12029]|uniref:Vps54-domain-containing protein n=1 Tax=Exidia glandulosa HHB12029 TaxID=1314781 RepID=A0A165BZQ2_EXIGL|nr:Vps54-domain-containing protein [Exidia glandulosa HHB12029]